MSKDGDVTDTLPTARPAIPQPRPAGAPPMFEVMAKPTGAICNLDCEYCFFLSKESLCPVLEQRIEQRNGCTLSAVAYAYRSAMSAPPTVTSDWPTARASSVRLRTSRVRSRCRPSQNVPSSVTRY